jgi:hypothetical protein
MHTAPTAPPSLYDGLAVIWQQFLWPVILTALAAAVVLGLWWGACYLIDRNHRRSKVNRQWEDVIHPRL